MRIQHNISALNALRQLDNNNTAVSKNLEKLSSGYRINRAGDDAAGLAISEKMRGQIRGLDVAQQNAQDGISLVQTAEGALTETHSILQRMRELAVQSSNGTYQDEVDRENLNKEVTSLKSEIDRISSSTQFNKINLLDGSLSEADPSGLNTAFSSSVFTGAGANAGDIKVTADTAGLSVKFAAAHGAANAAWSNGELTITLDSTAATGYDKDEIATLIKNASGTAPAGADSLKVDFSGDITTVLDANASVTAITTADSTKAVIGSTANSDYAINVTKAGDFNLSAITFATGGEGATYDATTPGSETLDFMLNATDNYSASDLTAMAKQAGMDALSFDFEGTKTGTEIAAGYGSSVTVTDGTGDVGSKGVTFQIGANGVEDQRVSLSVGDMSTKGLGISGIDISSQDSATSAIDYIDTAINSVSGTRADLGALQNRLEHTVTNLGTTSENLTSAESRIRDVDMAKEMMEMTKNNILTQAAQAMLAQANTQPQGVLQLLQ
ncbi:MAG: flagellin [Anaerofustis sp.]